MGSYLTSCQPSAEELGPLLDLDVIAHKGDRAEDAWEKQTLCQQRTAASHLLKTAAFQTKPGRKENTTKSVRSHQKRGGSSNCGVTAAFSRLPLLKQTDDNMHTHTGLSKESHAHAFESTIACIQM